MNSIHAGAIVIDGLINARWDRPVFEDLRKGGLTAAHCAVSVWEDFKGTVHNRRQLAACLQAGLGALSMGLPMQPAALQQVRHCVGNDHSAHPLAAR